MPQSPPSSKTRSALAATHLLHTPESFVRTPMPGLMDGMAIVHASPELGARFLWFTVELAAGGSLMPSNHSRFIFMLEGEAKIAMSKLDIKIWANDYAYSPPHDAMTLRARTNVRCVVIDKPYETLAGTPDPAAFFGRESDLVATPLNGIAELEVRAMMPADFAYDFAVNTMTYAPGTPLPQVEIHYMEHGLLMLEGSGPYRLGEQTYPVQAGDFIWMAPYCPQWFQADENGSAKYLIYKNFNRMPAL